MGIVENFDFEIGPKFLSSEDEFFKSVAYKMKSAWRVKISVVGETGEDMID